MNDTTDSSKVNNTNLNNSISNSENSQMTKNTAINDKNNEKLNKLIANNSKSVAGNGINGNSITKGDLTIYNKYLELVYYTNKIVRKYPKSEKFALVNEIKQELYAGLKQMLFAIKTYNKYDKLKYLKEFDMTLSLLKVQIRISFKFQYISQKNYTAWSNLVTDVCNMLGGWISSCQKR